MNEFLKLPEIDKLNRLFDLNEDKGSLTWKTTKYKGKQTPFRVKIDGKLYLTHRIIYCMFHGIDPGNQLVDHINRDRTDNSINNLRLVTYSQNSQNSNRKGYSKTPYGKYCVRVDGKHIANFNTEEEARERFIIEKNKRHGKFSPYQ